jgi:hypothetical protein
MPIFYEIFPTSPDFQDAMEIGETSRRSDINIALGAPMEARWPAESRRTAACTVVLRGPTETRNFREFLMRIRGRWRPFQWPSWTRDFRATGTSAAGDTTLTVQRNFEEFLDDDTPDAAGRNIWCYTPGRTFWIGRVVTAIDSGGESVLTVNPPLPFAEDLTRCIFGFCWFARMAEDEITWQHLTPDRASVRIGIVEARNQQDREVDQAVAGLDIYESNAIARVQEFPVRPELDELQRWDTQGPNAWETPQTAAFYSDWHGRLDQDGVTWFGPAQICASDLWDGDPEATDHISGAFDVLSREALCWQKEPDLIRARWYQSGVPQAIEFPGRSPLFFQNWTINGEISGGEADLVIYYIKEGEGKIYARAQRDAFADEYVAVATPVMPLWLTEVFRSPEGERVWIEGMTACHNLGRWESGLYNPPTPPMGDIAGATIEAAWSYDYPTVELPLGGDGGAAGLEDVTGVYAFSPTATIRDATVEDETGVTSPEIEAEYLYVMVDAGIEQDVSSASIYIEADAMAVAQDTGTNDQTATSIQISGAYEN